MSTDPDHRFELALDLRKMDIAHKVLEELGNKDEDRYVLSMLKYVILSHTQCVSCCTDASSIGTYY